VFLFYRIDRLARRLSVALELFARLQSLGVATRSATEAFDTSTPQGRMVVSLLATFAEFERDSLIERIVRGNAEKASRGHWVGGKPAFGYRVADDRKTLVVVESEADVVRRIFREYIDGSDGVVEIVKRLNADGVPTPTRSTWKVQSVIDILRRPTYVGYIVYKDEAYEGAFEAVIDRATFDKAQKLLDARGDMSTRKSSTPEYLLTGLVRCTSCGSHYVGGAAFNRDGERYRYYRCRKRALEAPAVCKAPNVRADLLERAIIDLVVDTYGKVELFERAVSEAVQSSKASRTDMKRRLKAVDVELAKSNQAAERYATGFEEGSLKLEYFADRMDQLTKRRFALERERSALQEEMGRSEVALVPSELLQEIRASVGEILGGEITARKKEIMRLVIDHIDLAPGRTATPVLRVPAARKDDKECLSRERHSRTKASRRTVVRLKVDWVELGGIEPPSIRRCTPVIRPFPTFSLTQGDRRVS